MVGGSTRKIALVGAHGTGKTTLANALSTEWSDRGLRSVVVPEVPRFICDVAREPTFFRRGQNSLTRQLAILVGQPVFEASAAATAPDLVISDRAILDHWAYTTHLHGHELDAAELRAPLLSIVAKHCATYDYIFYVPIEFDARDDGTREDDVPFQHAIDAAILGLLSTLSLSYVSVGGDVAARVKSVVTSVGQSPRQ